MPFFASDAEDSLQQQISNFTLFGYNKDGQKEWDLMGRQADINGTKVSLTDVESILYDTNQTVAVTAKKGDFDRAQGNISLKENVVVKTSTGIALETQQLDWDRQQKIVWTKQPVNIRANDVDIKGVGICAQQDMRLVSLEKDVKVEFPENTSSKEPEIQHVDSALKKTNTISITCEGPLEIDTLHNRALFTKNVKVVLPEAVMESDTLEVFFSGKQNLPNHPQSEGINSSKVEKIIARQNVRITKDGNCSFSNEAIYTLKDKKLVLSGSPQLVIETEKE
ncbi:MAG: LPS export ABC transporter periplasmic protein LptC [Candidatus Omnitrophica bacterium]|nr:LPS export ABC transporter periplasmic protein LptC [Candidatus Omnitrophota bacterium]